MSDIFISYANEDLHRIQSLVEALEAQGWSVFWDRTIPSGKTWREFIGKGLRDARCIVVAWSKTSIDSVWVQEEADEGRERGILHPVLIDDVKPPLGFRAIQAAKLAGWNFTDPSPEFKRFLRDLENIIGPPRPEESLSSSAGMQPQEQRLSQMRPAPGMMKVPKGPFLYGDDNTLTVLPYDYWIDKYPVTNEKYRVFVQAVGTKISSTGQMDLIPKSQDTFVNGTRRVRMNIPWSVSVTTRQRPMRSGWGNDYRRSKSGKRRHEGQMDASTHGAKSLMKENVTISTWACLVSYLASFLV